MTSAPVELGEFIDVVMGQAPPGSACNKEGTGTVFVKAGEFQERVPLVREWTTKPLKMAVPSDSLVCVVGATAGKVNYSAFECAIGRSVAAVRAQSARLDPLFLYQFLQTRVRQLRDRSQGAAQGVITREMLQSLRLVIPPLADQRRIASILDKADTIRTKRRDALAQLDLLAKAVFLDMFGDPRCNPKGWPVCPFAEVGDNQDAERIPVKSSDRDGKQGEYPYYGASGVIDWVDDFIFHGERLLIGEDGANLLARSTPVAFVADGKYWVNNHAHVIAANGKANLRYLEFFIERTDLTPYISGSAQPKLNRSNLDRIPVMLPPPALQDEFSARLSTIRGARAHAVQSLSLVDSLFASLQHRAFRGEL